jgi:hypothetical protein
VIHAEIKHPIRRKGKSFAANCAVNDASIRRSGQRPEVIERLMGAPDILLEQVMRRPWPGIWVAQNHLLFEPIRS